MSPATYEYTSSLRVRLSASDAHYGGQLVNGARLLALFGDVATELAILCDGDEGLLVGYEQVELLAPLYAGDFVEVTGRITRIGRTSRRIEFEAYKVIAARLDISESAADVLATPLLVGKAVGTTVVKTERQRKLHMMQENRQKEHSYEQRTEYDEQKA
jgi:3-aminobutyryl-CoA ammonia-lyase